ncbi:MAG: DUF4124 domain-containing protein [Steroidobacteraceae bacterium]|jgi:hypothetical protein|nr:DUF4124 domain-containing protein [Steroidobacteraceae bacterium]
MRIDVRSLARRLLPACALGTALVLPATVAAQDEQQEERSAPRGATLYKWVDERGVTHYSDLPRPGAEKLAVQPAQGFRPPPARAAAAGPRADGSAAAEPRGFRVAITRPAQDEVFVNPGGPIDLSASIDPAPGAGQQTWFLLNGQRLDDVPAGARSASVTLPRGSHTLTVQVVDEAGRALASSAPVTFHVRQTSIATPPQGPLLQRPGPGGPTPRPRP